MINKKLMKPIFYILLIVTTINLYSCNKSNNISFSTNVNEVKEKINQDTDYTKYIEVTMKQPVILPEPVTDEKGNISPDYNYLSENLIFKNISDKTIKFDVRIFLTKELVTSIAYAPTWFGVGKEKTLEPGKLADTAAAIIMKKKELLTDKEKIIYANYSGIVYVELKIDEKFYRFIQKTDYN